MISEKPCTKEKKFELVKYIKFDQKDLAFISQLQHKQEASTNEIVLNKKNVSYEEIKQELKRILLYECRCNERLKDKAEVSTRLTYTGL